VKFSLWRVARYILTNHRGTENSERKKGREEERRGDIC